MAKLTGVPQVTRVIERAITRSLGNRVQKFIKSELENALESQTQVDGSPFPKKAESTKKAYRRKGWDTEHFLVATGKSSKLVHGQTGMRLRVYPRGYDIQEFHLPRVQWIGLPQGAQDRVVDILKEDIANELK